MFGRSICMSFSQNYKLLLILAVMPILHSCNPGATEGVLLTKVQFPAIPPALGDSVQPGLAGPVAGVYNNQLLVAGGANFENGLPWRGGKKVYHNEIYLMEKTGGGSYLWRQMSSGLPFPIAYPACVSTPEGILSIGGENLDGPLNHVSLFTIQDGQLHSESLLALPQAVSSAGAASIGSTVFVVGGLTSKGATSSFYSFNLQNKSNGWNVLPELPLALSHAVVVAQNDGEEDCVYVIGGRNKTSEVTTFYSWVWKFKPSVQKWISEGDILSEGKRLGLSAGTGIAVGGQYIILFGGDPGIYFNRTERLNGAIEKALGEDKKRKLWNEKDEMLRNHPGFLNDVWSFDTRSKRWKKIGSLTDESPATTSTFMWNGIVVIPSGEIRPGVRTPKILGFEIVLRELKY